MCLGRRFLVPTWHGPSARGPGQGQPAHAAAHGPRLLEISSRRLHLEAVRADPSRQALLAPSPSILVGYSMNRRSRDDADTSGSLRNVHVKDDVAVQ